MCKTSLTSSPEGQAIGEDFNRAILLMLGAPYLVFAAVGGVLFRPRLRAACQRLRARLSGSGRRGLPPDLG